jgi:hypothetical protein
LILQNGPAMREAQEQVSKRIVKLLGLTSATLREEIAAGPAAALTEKARAVEKARTLARPQRVSARAQLGKPSGPRRKVTSAAQAGYYRLR